VDSGVELTSLMSTMTQKTTKKHLIRHFERFVDSSQLDYRLLQFLIKESIEEHKSSMQTKSLELLLDIFSIGFYVEQYLDDLLLIKEGEEAEYYEKITDSCSFLENNKEKYKSRVFTESEEFQVIFLSSSYLWQV
jgi:hypothetical protein